MQFRTPTPQRDQHDALSTVTRLLRILAGAVLIATVVLAALVEALGTDKLIDAALSVITIAVGTVLTLVLCSLAEGIVLVLDIERNTRGSQPGSMPRG